MKTKMMIFMLICILSACDPVTYGAYKLKNSTDEPLKVYFYSSTEVENDTVSIQNKSTIDWRVVSVSGSGPKKIDMYKYFDSIKIE